VYRWNVLCFKILMFSPAAPFTTFFPVLFPPIPTTIPAKCPPATMSNTHLLSSPSSLSTAFRSSGVS
jgi:hypothetical protein